MANTARKYISTVGMTKGQAELCQAIDRSLNCLWTTAEQLMHIRELILLKVQSDDLNEFDRVLHTVSGLAGAVASCGPKGWKSPSQRHLAKERAQRKVDKLKDIVDAS